MEVGRNFNDLSKTVDNMLSHDYKKRMIAEYEQVTIRANLLSNYIHDMDAPGIVPKHILWKQLDIMNEYANILYERAKIEHIEEILKY